jgi:Flp pilus assembly protein TadG
MTSPSGQRAHARSRPLSGRTRRARDRGQALVELALILPVMLLLLLGALDLGRIFYANITVASAAKEAALNASTGGSDPAAAAVNEARGGFVTIAAVDVATTGTCSDSSSFADIVVATVDAQFHAITPYIGAFLGGQDVTLTGQATAYCAVLPTGTPVATPTPTPGPTPTPTPTPTPACVTVPNVVGSDVSAANTTLSNLGFVVAEVADLSNGQKGKVQSQSPAAGPCAPYGSTVTIHYRPPRA